MRLVAPDRVCNALRAETRSFLGFAEYRRGCLGGSPCWLSRLSCVRVSAGFPIKGSPSSLRRGARRFRWRNALSRILPRPPHFYDEARGKRSCLPRAGLASVRVAIADDGHPPNGVSERT